MSIPLWVLVSLWIMWSTWAVYELFWFIQIVHHNMNNYRKVHYTKSGWQVLLLFLVLSVFWMSWNIFG